MGSGSRVDHDSRKTLPSTQRLGCLFCIKNDYLLVILKALILAGNPAYSQVTRSHVEEETSPSRHMTLEVKSKTSTACSYFFASPPPRPFSSYPSPISLFLSISFLLLHIASPHSLSPILLFPRPPHSLLVQSFSYLLTHDLLRSPSFTPHLSPLSLS